jgi:hypothetical protein
VVGFSFGSLQNAFAKFNLAHIALLYRTRPSYTTHAIAPTGSFLCISLSCCLGGILLADIVKRTCFFFFFRSLFWEVATHNGLE